MTTTHSKRSRIFVNSLVLYVVAFLFLKFAFPPIAKAIAGTSVNLPIPGTLFLWYMILITACFFVYLSSNEKDLADFLAPVVEAIRGKGGIHGVIFKIAFVCLPLLVGYEIYDCFVPKVVVPSSTRQQHPGMSNPNAVPYVGLKNPFRDPTPEMLAAFVEKYNEEDPREGEMDIDAMPPRLDTDSLDPSALKELFVNETIVEGRQLYQKNCRACHGTGHDGAGPVAKTFKLRPVAFTDPGTIATLVEEAVFWRVSEGGIGLPDIATPWDSPMPKWKDELTEEDRWKIIMAIYSDIGMEPRVLEMKVN
ncbi:MAG: c-type cytochrome [Lentisphaeria bacterium]|jgi:mono/diheme cytochrome c family protein|nr:c-type cytochrome [Lentisphaeria bacterium]